MFSQVWIESYGIKYKIYL